MIENISYSYYVIKKYLIDMFEDMIFLNPRITHFLFHFVEFSVVFDWNSFAMYYELHDCKAGFFWVNQLQQREWNKNLD